VRDPAAVLPTLAWTLGFPVEELGERQTLLLLDNLEQVVVFAPELAALVETCPNLTLLVTSREVLRVRGEVGYEVLPLGGTDAVELFTARARIDASPAVEELCRRLDNMPLALELAPRVRGR
jgi:predicted ATPase